jgi:hypothetical protein
VQSWGLDRASQRPKHERPVNTVTTERWAKSRADVGSGEPSLGADVAGVSPVPDADVGRGEPSPGADVSTGEPSPGADVAQVRPVPVQMWQGVRPVPVQMRLRPVSVQMWQGPLNPLETSMQIYQAQALTQADSADAVLARTTHTHSGLHLHASGAPDSVHQNSRPGGP